MDKELLIKTVIAAQNGDKTAMNRLFEAHYQSIYYYALKNCKNDSDIAFDVTQNTFLELIKYIKTLENPEFFTTWMYRIAHNQCAKYFKKNREVILDADEEGFTDIDRLPESNEEFIPDAALDREDFKKTIMSILDELPDVQRSAVIMYYFDEMSVKDIAYVQNVSEGTVKSRLNYARKAIKEAVNDYEKKHNVSLHAIPFFPFFGWLLDGVFKEKMEEDAAKLLANNITAESGIEFSPKVSDCLHGNGFLSKLAKMPLGIKMIAGAIAVSLAYGSVPAALYFSSNRNNKQQDDEQTVQAQTSLTPEKTEPLTRFKNEEVQGRWSPDTITAVPVEVYYEDGKWYATCYIVNGYDHDVNNVHIQNVYIIDKNGTRFADGNFPAQNLSISSLKYSTHTFIFNDEAILSTNVDLATIRLGINFSVNHLN